MVPWITSTTTITLTNVVSDTVGVSVTTYSLAVDPTEMLAVIVGWLLTVAMVLFVFRFQQWILILTLICTLTWLPFSLSPYSLTVIVIVLFALLMMVMLNVFVNLVRSRRGWRRVTT